MKKVDVSKLRTVAEYAKIRNVTTMSVYRWIAKGEVKTTEINGVKFIVVK
jgi:hypothetical protein